MPGSASSSNTPSECRAIRHMPKAKQFATWPHTSTLIFDRRCGFLWQNDGKNRWIFRYGSDASTGNFRQLLSHAQTRSNTSRDLSVRSLALGSFPTSPAQNRSGFFERKHLPSLASRGLPPTSQHPAFPERPEQGSWSLTSIRTSSCPRTPYTSPLK